MAGTGENSTDMSDSEAPQQVQSNYEKMISFFNE
jgi:hypothetical protein